MWDQEAIGALPLGDGVAPEGVGKEAELADARDMEFDLFDVWAYKNMRLAIRMRAFRNQKCEEGATDPCNRDLWGFLLHIDGKLVGGAHDTRLKTSGLAAFLLRVMNDRTEGW